MLQIQVRSSKDQSAQRAVPQVRKVSAQSVVRSLVMGGLSLLCALGLAQTDPAKTSPAATPAPKPQDWNFHLQNTDVVQGDPGFSAKYSGPNSLNSHGEVQQTSSIDLFAGKRLWRGAELHVDGLIWQGFGLSETLGVEAFPSGDAYKYGTQIPDYMVARLFIRQTFGLGGEQEDVPDGQLTLAGKQDIKRLTLTVGRFSPTDISDTNAYASSPQTQFMNWGMVNSLTWDYAADSVGFAPGFAVELNQPKWALRYGCFMMPPVQNGFTGDDEFLMWPPMGSFGPFFKAWAMNAEFERRYSFNSHPGSIRLQGWVNEADMYSYLAASRLLEANGPQANLSAASAYSYKVGYGLNWEQEVAKNVGMFSRAGWNDGREEAWAFTDANWSASLGVSVKGDAWHRAGDTFGFGGIVSGASADQQKFLEAGGLGILDGDGALTYAPEEALETYYDTQVCKNVRCALDYQFVANPAFNSDRGPVSVFGFRFHVEF